MLILDLFWISTVAFSCISTVSLTEHDSMKESQELQQRHHGEHNRCPWIPVGFVYSPGVFRLHTEIEQFYEYMQLTLTERALRENVIARFKSVVLELWPNAHFKLYGSFSIGLALPDSDIDIMVLGITDPSYLQSLKAKLETSNIAKPNSVVIRDENVRIPIIEFVDRESQINIDIKFTDDPSVKFDDLVDEDKHKAFLKLMFVLKQFLKQRNLNDVFTGGISSFTTSLLCINFLQMYPYTKANEDLNLGELVLGFLKLYGHEFNYDTVGVSVRNGGKRLPRNELPCGITNGNYSLFCVERPLEPWINDGIETYRGPDVKDAFYDAYNLLKVAMSSVKNEPNDCSEYSILSHIVYATDRFIQHRNWVRDTFENTLLKNTTFKKQKQEL